MTFTTLPGPPSIENPRVEAVTSNSASAKAHVNPGGADTSILVQFGPTAEYGWQTAPFSCGTTAQDVAMDIGGLLSGTTYHCRLVSGNQYGVISSPDIEFTTVVVPPKLRAIGFSPLGFWLSMETPGPGQYQIETSSDAVHWDYFCVIPNPDSVFEFVDTEAPPLGTRFYRVVMLKP